MTDGCVRVAHGLTPCREATDHRTYWCVACKRDNHQRGK